MARAAGSQLTWGAGQARLARAPQARGVGATKRELAWPAPHQPVALTWMSWPGKED